MTDIEVLNFIKTFAEVKDFFLYGHCYHFALILEQMFMATICYLPIKNHFVARIHNEYYDASGKVKPDEKVYVWSTYQYLYPSDCRSIIRDCVYKYEV